MNTTITIDMPEVALFDGQELKTKLVGYIKSLAKRTYRTQAVATAISADADIKYIRSLHAVGGTVVPADENGKGLMAEKYL